MCKDTAAVTPTLMAVVVAISRRPYGVFVCDVLVLYSLSHIPLFFFPLQPSAAAVGPFFFVLTGDKFRCFVGVSKESVRCTLVAGNKWVYLVNRFLALCIVKSTSLRRGGGLCAAVEQSGLKLIAFTR